MFRGGAWPEVANLGLPGGYLGWGLAVELYRGMGNPPRVRVGFGEVRSTKFGDHGGEVRRRVGVSVFLVVTQGVNWTWGVC